MQLEQELKRTFSSDQERTFINLNHTVNWLEGQYKNYFKQFDITPQQYNILKLLKNYYPNPCRANVLQGQMVEKMSDVSRIVERLRLKGLVDRRWKEGDRRSVDIVITNKAVGLLFKIDSDIHRIDNMFLRLNASELAALNQMLDKLRG